MRNDASRFVGDFAIFLFFLGVALWALNTLYIGLVAAPYSREGLKEQSYQRTVSSLSNKELKYLFLGDSEMFYSVNPAYINDSFNFGMDSDNYVGVYYTLRKVIYRDKVKVDSVVLGIGFHTFSHNFTKPRGYLNPLWYYGDVPYDELLSLKNPGELLRSYLIVIGSGEYFFQGGTLTPISLDPRKPEFPGGWDGQDINFSGTEESRLESARAKVGSFVNSEEDQVSYEYFEKTLELAKENNITVIILRFPVTKYYDQAILERNVSRDEHYGKIFSRVDSIVGYYDLDYYSIFFNNTEYFGDPNHLNEKGSGVFSKILAGNLKRIESGEIRKKP